NPAFQAHPNKASGLSVVALVTPDVETHTTFATAFTGVAPHFEGEQVSFPLARGRLDLMSLDDAGEAYGSVEIASDQTAFAAFGVRVEDVRMQAHHLDAAKIPYQRIGSRLVVPASAAFGVAIAFEAT
ncbi:VOC family protein, partial [Corallococcus exiguus]|nr:VOC family protein [Corallococcus exiguus]